MSILNTVNESDGGDMRVWVRADEVLSSFAFNFFSLGFPTVIYFSVFDDFIFDIFQSIREVKDVSCADFSIGIEIL